MRYLIRVKERMCWFACTVYFNRVTLLRCSWLSSLADELTMTDWASHDKKVLNWRDIINLGINHLVAFDCVGCDATEVRGCLLVWSPSQSGKSRAIIQTRFTPQLDKQWTLAQYGYVLFAGSTAGYLQQNAHCDKVYDEFIRESLFINWNTDQLCRRLGAARVVIVERLKDNFSSGYQIISSVMIQNLKFKSVWDQPSSHRILSLKLIKRSLVTLRNVE